MHGGGPHIDRLSECTLTLEVMLAMVLAALVVTACVSCEGDCMHTVRDRSTLCWNANEGAQMPSLGRFHAHCQGYLYLSV